MKRTIHILFPAVLLVWAACFLASCEKDITVNIPQADKKPVVDGSIFEGEVAKVGITWSFPYFKPLNNLDPNNPATLEEFLVLNAVVTVSDGLLTDTLQFSYDPAFFPPLIYKGTHLTGVAGKTYSLHIQFPGYDLSAITTIPYPVPLDSIGFKVEAGEDSLGFAYMYFQEPPAVGNIYRLFSKRPSYNAYKPTAAIGNSVLDDQAYNGQYIEFLFGRPRAQSKLFNTPDDTTSTDNDNEGGYWKLGDTIMVRFCTIDRPAYDYIKTLENSAGTSGNPFSNPTTVKSNITGGNALGGWVGYGVFDIQRVAQ